MSRQATVGAFTILGLLGLFAIFFVLANYSTQGRYRIGVHFKSAAGLHRGALVYESGVIVGTVDQTRLIPEDFTVEVIVAVNNNIDIPRDSKFVIAAPITGDVTLEIVPPGPPSMTGVVGASPEPRNVALLPREVLPLDQQPIGQNPATITDLLQQGQSQVNRLDRMLAELERREPKLLDTLQATIQNANELTVNGNRQVTQLFDRFDRLTASLQVALDANSANLLTGTRNLADLSQRLDTTVGRNQGNVDALFTQLLATSRSLRGTVDSVRDLATNPDVHGNLVQTTRGLAQTATIFAGIATDLRKVTSDQQTQGQLRETVANIDAATQRLNSLLRQLGGTSAVYGVDPGATPIPGASAGPAGAPGAATPATRPVPAGSAAPGAPAAGPAPALANIRDRFSAAAANLVRTQVRVQELSSFRSGSSVNPILEGNDRGPRSDFNLIVLPKGKTSLLVGGNDIGGGHATLNFAQVKALRPDLHVGAGVLYSRLGGFASYQPGRLGGEVRVYDPRHPTVDLYGDVNLRNGVQLFGGERDVINNGRRTVFGLQLEF